MENLVNGLNLLMTYVQQVNRQKAVSAFEGQVVVAPTDRQMTYNDVRLLTSFGWSQVGEGEYDVTKPWTYAT